MTTMPYPTTRRTCGLSLDGRTYRVVLAPTADGGWHAFVLDETDPVDVAEVAQAPDRWIAPSPAACLARVAGDLAGRTAISADEDPPASTRTAPWEEPAPAPPAPITLVPREERAAALTSTVDGAIARLAEQLGEGHSTEFLAFLAFLARFRRYSVHNCLLIRAQRPEAQLVAGVRRWNELGYRVRPGEKALWIWGSGRR